MLRCAAYRAAGDAENIFRESHVTGLLYFGLSGEMPEYDTRFIFAAGAAVAA